jgi:enoyl-CoA hydratase/carnithine racemase
MVAVDTNYLEIDEGSDVVTVKLARPEKLNALLPEMIDGLVGVFEALTADPGRGVLLTGRGDVTCAGMDTEIVSGDYEGEHADLDATLQRLYGLIDEYPAPVAIAAKGALVGAGAVLSLSCEFLVLGEETTVAVPEVGYGIASERAATLLPELVGRRVAAELLLTGEPIDPGRAKRVGFANDVVPEGDVERRTRELLETVAEHDRETVTELLELLGDGR